MFIWNSMCIIVCVNQPPKYYNISTLYFLPFSIINRINWPLKFDGGVVVFYEFVTSWAPSLSCPIVFIFSLLIILMIWIFPYINWYFSWYITYTARFQLSFNKSESFVIVWHHTVLSSDKITIVARSPFLWLLNFHLSIFAFALEVTCTYKLENWPAS